MSLARISIPQPCAESWDAMMPAGAGRHCAACQKVVVDFTEKTDAEILAYLARARGETCGHFYKDQLDRPLQAAAVPAPVYFGRRWRAGLALVLAAWGARPAEAARLPAPAPTHRIPHRPAARVLPRAGRQPRRYVQGVVRDAATQQVLAGVAVFLRAENRSAVTDANGWFRLQLTRRRPRGGRALVLHFAGYHSETARLPATTKATTRLTLALQPDPAASGAEVVGYGITTHREVTGGAVWQVLAAEKAAPEKSELRRPYPWHPRSFWRWLTTRRPRAATPE